MADIKAPLFASDGSSKGTVSLDAEIFGVEPNLPVMHQVVTAQLAGASIEARDAKGRGHVHDAGVQVRAAAWGSDRGHAKAHGCEEGRDGRLCLGCIAVDDAEAAAGKRGQVAAKVATGALVGGAPLVTGQGELPVIHEGRRLLPARKRDRGDA